MSRDSDPLALPPHPILWLATAEVPIWDWSSWSKNRTHARRAGGARGARVATRAARSARYELAAVLRHALGRAGIRLPLAPARLWVAVRVQLADRRRRDAANALDLVLDAIQDATELDDRWSAVARLWSEPGPPAAIRVWVGRDASPI